jgi:hypothetical protein
MPTSGRECPRQLVEILTILNSFVSLAGATWICQHKAGNTPRSSIEGTPPPENSFVEEASVTGATWICRHQLGNTPHSSIEETPPRTPSKNSFVEEASLAGAIWICRYQVGNANIFLLAILF